MHRSCRDGRKYESLDSNFQPGINFQCEVYGLELFQENKEDSSEITEVFYIQGMSRENRDGCNSETYEFFIEPFEPWEGTGD